MIFNPCYLLVDKDGDVVTACNEKTPFSVINDALNEVMYSHPQNGPFKIIRWNGKSLVEISPVT